MGQIISNLWRWIFRKMRNETQRNVHPQTNYQTFSSHTINITDPPVISTIENEGNHGINSNAPIPDIVFDMSSGYEGVAKKRKRKKKKKEPNIEQDDQSIVSDVVLEKSVTTSITHHHPQLSSVKKIGQYTSAQRLLLVGEGDFSFSACLAAAFGSSATNIVATSLNSTKYLTENYAMFGNNKMELESRGSTVLHNVDATNMVKHDILQSMVFDRIIFNFPHAGNFCCTVLRQHQQLISGFLRNAKKMIQENGEIHITAKSNGCYLEWDIPKLGSDEGLNLIQVVKFKSRIYPGYNTKYGYAGDRNMECNPSKTYKFGLSHK